MHNPCGGAPQQRGPLTPQTQTRPNRLHTHTHPPKRLAHPRSPIPPLSTLTSRATHAHPTSPCSTGFCAIWDCINSSSIGKGRRCFLYPLSSRLKKFQAYTISPAEFQAALSAEQKRWLKRTFIITDPIFRSQVKHAETLASEAKAAAANAPGDQGGSRGSGAAPGRVG